MSNHSSKDLRSLSLLSLIFSIAMNLTACGETKQTAGESRKSDTKNFDTSSSVISEDRLTSSSNLLTGSRSALPLANYPFPGPYNTIQKNGVTLRQGRFPAGKFGGTLVRYMFGEPKVFNPWAATETKSQELGCLMFPGLAMIDPFTGETVPDLAESIEIDKDNVTYVVKLRKGITWSDGKPITAKDVTFTWNTIVKDGYGNSSFRDVTLVQGKSPVVTAIDAQTIRFVTAAPFAPFKRLLSIPIAPEHVLAPVIRSSNGRQAFDRFWSANCEPQSLVVSGPFKLKKYLPAQRVELVPNKSYAAVNASGERLPYLSQLTFLIVPDSNTVLLKFRAKETDVSLIRPRDVVDMMQAREKDNFQMHNLGASTSSIFIAFNMNKRSNPKSKKPFVAPYKSAWFNDLNFRQAVNHAMNRKQMVANCFKGVGLPLVAAEAITSPYCNQNLKPIEQDLDYSRKLLEKSGYKKDAGNLFDKDGKRVEFTMVTAAGSSFNEAAGNMITTDLAKLGIKVNMQYLDFNILVDKINNSLDWDTCLFTLKPGDPLEPNDSCNVYKSDGRLHLFDQRLPDKNGKVVVTDARPWEKRIDELFDKGAVTLSKEARVPIYNEYQQIIYDQAPFVFLTTYLEIYGARNSVRNYQPTPLSQNVCGLHNIDEIYKE